MDCKNCVLSKYGCGKGVLVKRQKSFDAPIKIVLAHPTVDYFVMEVEDLDDPFVDTDSLKSKVYELFDRFISTPYDIVFTMNCMEGARAKNVHETRQARESCVSTFREDLKGAKVIVACGNDALEALGYKERTWSKSVGWVAYNEEWQASVLAMADPHKVMEDQGHLWKDFVWTIQQAEAVALGKRLDRNLEFELDFTVAHSVHEIPPSVQQIQSGAVVAADIETNTLCFYEEDESGNRTAEIEMLAIYHPDCGPVILSKECVYSPEFKVWFEHFQEKHQMLYHNSKFDTTFISACVGVKATVDHDTIALHKYLDERTGTHGLERLLRVYLNWFEYWAVIEGYKKDKGFKSYAESIPFDVLAKYAGYDVKGTYELFRVFTEQLRDDRDKEYPWRILLSQQQSYEKVLMPVYRELVDVELKGVDIDPVVLREYTAELGPHVDRLKSSLEEELFNETGIEVNLNSPAVLLKALKAAEIVPETLMTTDKNVLADYVKHPFIRRLLTYKQEAKVFSTYCLGSLKKMKATDEDRTVLYTQFSPVGTVGTRWSSKNQNLQQVPRQGRFKSVFIPEPGMWFFQFDYAALEARCAAYMAEDLVLAEACVGDLHSTVARSAFERFFKELAQLSTANDVVDFSRSHPMFLPTVETISLMAGSKTSFEACASKMTSHLRSLAKAITFGIFFGRGARALAQKELMCSIDEAQEFIDNYFKLFPKLHSWIIKIKTIVRTEGIIILPDGSTRDLRGWRCSPSLLDRKRELARAERQAVNILTQGLAGIINNLFFVKASRYLKQHGVGRVKGAVHDSVIGQIDKNSDSEYHLREIIKLGEGCLHNHIIKFAVDGEVGESWGDLKSIDEVFSRR